MIETVLRCHATDRRQPVKNPDELPQGWVCIPALSVGLPTGEKRELEDLHFASLEVLATWANTQQTLMRAAPTPHLRQA